MQTEENKSDENRIRERIKKSSMAAEDTFDYLKLTADAEGFIPCVFEETPEEVVFEYDVTGLKALENMERESEENKRRFLVNFARLYPVFLQYRFEMDEKNIFYDENMLPCVKTRDLYERDAKAEEAVFLYAYQCIAGGILSKKYHIRQVLESGSEILKKDKSLKEILGAAGLRELTDALRRQEEEFVSRKRKRIREVSRTGYLVWRLAAIVMLIAGIAAGAFAIYYGGFELSRQKSLVTANQRFITKDYIGCIDSLEDMEIEEMDVDTKYILAVAYASTESFQQEEISNIVLGLSVSSNEKELEYWISLGRLDAQQAENLALALSDDKLLIYAYMKEIDILENRDDMDGEEKKSRLDTLNNEIQALGEKYTTDEE